MMDKYDCERFVHWHISLSEQGIRNVCSGCPECISCELKEKKVEQVKDAEFSPLSKEII